MKHRLFCTALLPFLLLPIQAQNPTTKPDCFIRTIIQKPELVQGDSTLISFIFYTNGELLGTTYSSEPLQIKGATVRKLNLPRQNRNGRTIWNNRLYNTYLWAQYVVTTDVVKKLTIPSIDILAAIRIYDGNADPFAGFFSNNWKSTDYNVKVKSGKAQIKVQEKPKKTTLEIIHKQGKMI